MTSVFTRLCFAAALALGALGPSAPALAQTAPAPAAVPEWSDAEAAELNAILKDLLVPMMNDMNTAVSVSQSISHGPAPWRRLRP